MLPKLYEPRFFVAAALRSIGRVLPAKTMVEMMPAITGSELFMDRDAKPPTPAVASAHFRNLRGWSWVFRPTQREVATDHGPVTLELRAEPGLEPPLLAQHRAVHHQRGRKFGGEQPTGASQQGAS